MFADKVFQSPVPEEMRKVRTRKSPSSHSDTLGQHSAPGDSWEAFFGPSNETDEAFMAYCFALYVEKVTSVEKQAYNLPMFTNAWLHCPEKMALVITLRLAAESPGNTHLGDSFLRSLIYDADLLRPWISYAQTSIPQTTPTPVPLTAPAVGFCSFQSNEGMSMVQGDYGSL